MKRILILLAILIGVGNIGHSQPEYTAYIFIAEKCPVCNYYGKTLKRLSNAFMDDVKFVAVFPQKLSSLKSANEFKLKYDIPLLEIKIDEQQSLTKKFKASVTPEVVLTNKSDEVLYQGRISDAYAAPGRMRHGKIIEELEIAIKHVLGGRTVPKPWHSPVGCYITKT